jgi:hypothetical protein
MRVYVYVYCVCVRTSIQIHTHTYICTHGYMHEQIAVPTHTPSEFAGETSCCGGIGDTFPGKFAFSGPAKILAGDELILAGDKLALAGDASTFVGDRLKLEESLCEMVGDE